MDKLRLIISLITDFFIYGVAILLPKHPQVWVFGAWFGERYSDNSKAFFEYVSNSKKTQRAIWISKDKNIVKAVRTQGYESYYALSAPGIWFQLRSNYAFVCQALQDDLHAPCIGPKTKVVNLWHGLPLKKIMYDVFGDHAKKKNMKGLAIDFLSPYNKRRNDYLLATSIETQATLSKAFRVDQSRTLVTGFPRNDVFFSTDMQATTTQPYKCIYMPTFRGGMGSACDLFTAYNFDFQLFEKTLADHNIKLVLRMHPVNTPPEKLANMIKNSDTIVFDYSGDIFDTITEYDCMITDYSGAYFDFLLSGKPILFAPFDLKDYLEKERDLYYPYKEVTLEPYALSWPALISQLVELKENGPSSDYINKYEKLKNLFHAPVSQGSTPFSDALYNNLSEL
ncbi:CDP-glycerol glycerophosphotransferase family protein [Motiliproteus sp. MSK22-1]|uniref:CDP-glycerol glycerophosphotransferase family protein n=1 Tax=Motiliproteus sp. MSK22-1 TaxID=1897630 RepID=UPI0009777E36|nr:CDP-glycerol glycerophosphotransferase family protein [Motiliproteus sp. MSK22-1]OMH25673.1 hypothetical protein BGP75_24325 [Motiliproteus sp. MSK22-1]